MRLPKTSTPNKGFSLIELVVVLGILTLLASFTLVVSMDSYKIDTFTDQEMLLVGALQKARSQAMSGVCIGTSCTAGLAHGVYITSTAVTIFQGSNYNASDDINEALPFSSHSLSVSGVSEVVFAELSGDASPAGTITLSDMAGHNNTITIGSEGQIIW